MSFFNFVMALSPIVVVLVGILGFRQSAKRVAPVALLWGASAGLYVFQCLRRFLQGQRGRL